MIIRFEENLNHETDTSLKNFINSRVYRHMEKYIGGDYLLTDDKAPVELLGMWAIDDLIKNSDEAHNESILQQHWDWFTNTMYSRLEEGGKIIVVMTRWATTDFAGRILAHFGDAVEHINIPAVQPDGSMLCDEILSKERTQTLVTPRQVAMFLSCKLTTRSLVEIGRSFGKTHATVYHGAQTIQKRIDVESDLRKTVENITSQLGRNPSELTK